MGGLASLAPEGPKINTMQDEKKTVSSKAKNWPQNSTLVMGL